MENTGPQEEAQTGAVLGEIAHQPCWKAHRKNSQLEKVENRLILATAQGCGRRSSGALRGRRSLAVVDEVGSKRR